MIRDRLPLAITSAVATILYIAAGLRYKGFFGIAIFAQLFSENAYLGVVAVGMTFVILTGGIDLSVGAVVGCSSILAAKLVSAAHLHPAAAMGVALVYGVVLGAGQGWLIARYSLPPFLVTLGGLFFSRGLALKISQESIQIDHPWFSSITSFAIRAGGASIPATTIIFLVVLLVGIFLAKQTRFGRTVYAIGGSAASAGLMGLPVSGTIIRTYALSGLLAALGGVVLTIYNSSGNALSGTGLELDAIAAVVIGGTLLSGGQGSVFGTLLGLLTVGIVQSAINFDGTLSSWWSKIVTGILLLAFMLIQKALERTSNSGGHAA